MTMARKAAMKMVVMIRMEINSKMATTMVVNMVMKMREARMMRDDEEEGEWRRGRKHNQEEE